jgi:hypothetical protein
MRSSRALQSLALGMTWVHSEKGASWTRKKYDR